MAEESYGAVGQVTSVQNRYKMVTLGKKRAFHRGKTEVFNLLIFLVPEVGIEPT